MISFQQCRNCPHRGLRVVGGDIDQEIIARSADWAATRLGYGFRFGKERDPE